ncbi:MAG TPA: deoxyribodipyrimidine photo-lyase [Streptosporangiaceae bacterium]|nr:deoxyribodipyrimidine photo-lyase [Streptosporangiaceae bacterium]
MTTGLAVFTRDLRVSDNPVLAAAASASAQVIPCFVVDESILARYGAHATRLAFLADSLADLDASLRALGGALVVRRGHWAAAVLELARGSGASRIDIADDYSGYAQRRLAELEQAAAVHRVQVIRHPGITLVPPDTLVPPGRPCYQVFTPYYRRWRDAPRQAPLRVPARIALPAGLDPGTVPALSSLTSARPASGRPAGGEKAGTARLRAWARDQLTGYGTGRDLLAADSVSRLSPYLHLGCLSARTVAAEVAELPDNEAFLRQLAWRDFFHQLLAARPDSGWRDYRSRGDQWRDDSEALDAWQRGRTGYPVVDAAMRQLLAEGFMPNRARMIAASFLTKDLYLDWRLGAAHFMAQLADGDVACNQLNWQWVAGTGTDTSAYRVFSPMLQGRRFDPSGDYVRRYLPELAALPAGRIHDPDQAARRACGYPEPVVDHRAAVAEYRARRRASGRW